MKNLLAVETAVAKASVLTVVTLCTLVESMRLEPDCELRQYVNGGRGSE